jgi:prepilin-type processing-associated H-X9-DG protein
MARRDDDVDDFEDDDVDERPKQRRPAKSGGMSTGVIVAIVLGIVGVLGLCGCGVLAGLLLPAVQKVREAAARAKSQNNMKQVALGMFNDSDANGGFQAPYGGAPGNKDLSFRVGLLPYIEQQNLYQRINLTQAWDSPGNKPITDTVIPTYSDPANPSGGNQTPYRVFVGPGAVFDGSNKRILPATIRDGTSNTILFVSATQSVPWAKPQELPYGPGIPLPPLGSPGTPGGFNAAMADGSVRFIKGTIPEADLRSLIEANDGRQVILP